jgi:hypothetical protein
MKWTHPAPKEWAGYVDGEIKYRVHQIAHGYSVWRMAPMERLGEEVSLEKAQGLCEGQAK